MLVQTKLYKIKAVGISDLGLVRANNEDTWAELPKYNFYVLADGMGGHQAGEVASKEAVNTLCKQMKKVLEDLDEEYTLDEIRHFLIEAIEDVNKHVYQMGRKDPDLYGMGTTLCCLLFHPKGVIYAHVGDSRIYRYRNRKLQQLTKDHSLVRELLEMGQLSERQAGDYLYRNIITKAIGTESHVLPSARVADIKDGDLYLMCSDGLSDPVSIHEMETLINNHTDLTQLAEALVQSAKDKGGFDNITLVLTGVQKNERRKNIPRQ